MKVIVRLKGGAGSGFHGHPGGIGGEGNPGGSQSIGSNVSAYQNLKDSYLSASWQEKEKISKQMISVYAKDNFPDDYSPNEIGGYSGIDIKDVAKNYFVAVSEGSGRGAKVRISKQLLDFVGNYMLYKYTSHGEYLYIFDGGTSGGVVYSDRPQAARMAIYGARKE
jgi:hypothetical protein